jgi:hypothetical protein
VSPSFANSNLTGEFRSPAVLTLEFEANPSKKVTICHKGRKSLEVSANAVPAHLSHGDTLGGC